MQPQALARSVFYLFAGAVWCSLCPAAEAHYSCASDEVAGEVQGETGVVCGPKCGTGNLECPADVPDGTTAKPQCMLQDVDQVAYCGLLCQVDTQCPSGSSCRFVGQPPVGLCIHGLSFAEWAKEGTRRKLAVSVPARAFSSSKGAAIAKASQALQNLKQRFSISDGDADVLVVKELLSAASASSIVSPAQGAGSGLGIASSVFGSSAPALPVAAPAVAPAASPAPAQASSWNNPFVSDVKHFAGYLEDGVPGLEREAHDIINNLEHINQRGQATRFFRGVILAALLYVGVGAAYKYQVYGSRGVEMVPHIGFWNEYPHLVMDGVKYATLLVNELAGNLPKRPGGGNFMSMTSSDRDTFAHFEPSR